MNHPFDTKTVRISESTTKALVNGGIGTTISHFGLSALAVALGGHIDSQSLAILNLGSEVTSVIGVSLFCASIAPGAVALYFKEKRANKAFAGKENEVHNQRIFQQIAPFLTPGTMSADVARCLDERSGLHAIRRAGEQKFEVVSRNDFEDFKRKIAEQGKPLTVVNVLEDGANPPRLSALRYVGGLLHGDQPDQPAAVAVMGDTVSHRWYRSGVDITAEMEAFIALAEKPDNKVFDLSGTTGLTNLPESLHDVEPGAMGPR